MRRVPLAVLLLSAFPLCAQTPYLVKDINTTYSDGLKSSSPGEFAALGNKIFMSAKTDAAGNELWTTDGTAAGTSLIDIIPGTGSSNPVGFVPLNGLMLFNARDVDHGIELWASDGTAAGTHMILDINPGPNSSQPNARIVFNNRMLFMADDGTHGSELWVTDGTAAGTHFVKDINPGPQSSYCYGFVPFNGAVYFLATGGLWKTDGTEAGTVLAAATPGRDLVVSGSHLFFEGYSADTGYEPWISDGTAAGTHMIADILPGKDGSGDSSYGSVFDLVPLRNGIVFPADDGLHGREPWFSDGTAAGTVLLRDFLPGPKGQWDNSVFRATLFQDRVWFYASDPDHGAEPWVTDGTPAGTRMFADLNPGTASSAPYGFTISGGTLYFIASIAPTKQRLWLSDGTVSGTRMINVDVAPGGNGYGFPLWPVNGKIYFAGTAALTGTEPWVSDGTEAGTHIIANLAADRGPSSYPGGLTSVGNLVFFYAIDGIPTLYPGGGYSYNPSLWRSDGTAPGTFKLMDIGQHTDPLTAVGPYVFFDVPDAPGRPLMMSDGTIAGTKQADDFLSRFGDTKVTFLPFGNTVYATVGDSWDDTLWATTAAPNAPAVPLGVDNPYDFIDVAGHVMFWASSNGPVSYHYGLFTSDGTPAGTYAVVPDIGNNSGARPNPLVNAEGTVFYLLEGNSNTAPQLWKTDGTYDGTVVVKTLPIATNAISTNMVALGRKAFFVLGGTLYVSDGTDSGTIALASNIKFTSFQSTLAVLNNRVLFMPSDQTNGADLWSTDGTVSGTALVKHLGPSFANLTVIDGIAYLAGTDDTHGTELWVTDGTPDGTKMLVDVNPGPASSNPYAFTKVGNLLYFTAYTDAVGYELWAMPLTPPALSIADTRTTEGDSGTKPMHFTVSLASPASQTVTVDYATADGSAKAGTDYDAASGTLTFAPGETSKTFDVAIHGNTVPENNRTFFAALKNANGARIARSEAGGVIEDDDQAADLGVDVQFSTAAYSFGNATKITNSGPRTATDIVVNITSTPPQDASYCPGCNKVAQLAPGASTPSSGVSARGTVQYFASAVVSARQRDPQPSNNSVTWTTVSTMGMTPAFLTPGQSATVTALKGQQFVSVTSSDPSVVPAPTNITTVDANTVTFPVTALKVGTATLSINNVQSASLVVNVVASGTQFRLPNAISVSSANFFTTFDKPVTMTITPGSTALVSGAHATGTVRINAGNHELTRATLAGKPISVPIYFPSVGNNLSFEVDYDGDANFLPQAISGSATVRAGNAAMIAGLQRVDGSPGSLLLTVTASGSPIAPPTGTITVSNGGSTIAQLQLAASGATSSAQTTLTNISGSPTLTLNYSGDSFYAPSSQQVRLIVYGHAAHH